jgi:hypothetical protein
MEEGALHNLWQKLKGTVMVIVILYILVILSLQMQIYWDLSLAVKSGERSVTLCGMQYSEAETGRWKGVRVFTDGAGKKYGQTLVLMNLSLVSLYFVSVLAYHIKTTPRRKFDGSLFWKNIIAVHILGLLIGLSLMFHVYYLVHTKRMPVLKTAYFDVLKKSPAGVLQYIKKLKNTAVWLVLALILIPLYILIIRYEEVDSIGTVAWKPSKNIVEYAVVLGPLMFFLATTLYAMFSYITSVKDIVSTYKNVYVNDGFSGSKVEHLQFYATQLYKIFKKETGNAQLAANTAVIDAVGKYFVTNIKSIEIVDGDMPETLLRTYAESMWKYILHNDGNELNEIAVAMKSFQARSGVSDDRVDTTPADLDLLRLVKNYIKIFGWKPLPERPSRLDTEALKYVGDVVIGTRKLMTNLRRYNKISTITTAKFNISLTLLFTFIMAIVYPAFNHYYKQNPTYATMAMCAFVLVLIIGCGLTGMVYSAKGL